MPQVNGLLLVAVVLLVLGFRSSSALSAAYGIAVTGEMLVTSILLLIVMWRIWKWNVYLSLLVVVPLGLVDLGFLIANFAKFEQGGWVPAVVSSLIDARSKAAAPVAADVIARLVGIVERQASQMQDLVSDRVEKKLQELPWFEKVMTYTKRVTMLDALYTEGAALVQRFQRPGLRFPAQNGGREIQRTGLLQRHSSKRNGVRWS